MKVNISDLLDDFTPEQELDFLESNKETIHLNAVKRRVSKKIAQSKGDHFMSYHLRKRIAAVCLCGLAVLTIGGITVNAATGGALADSIRVTIIGKDGTEEKSLNFKDAYKNEEGNMVFEYALPDESFVIAQDGDSAEIVVEDMDGALSYHSSVSETGEEDEQITVDTSGSGNHGIDLEKYEGYAPGTYEETNDKGVTYSIHVSESGSVTIKEKE